MIKSTLVHSGQYRRYGDSYTVYEIETDEDIEAVKEYIKTLTNTPEEEEFLRAYREGGEHEGDYGYYFAGYHKLTKTADGYRLSICRPFTD